MQSLTLLFVLVFITVSSKTTHAGLSRFHAAKCIKQSTSCTRSVAAETGFTCRRNVDALKQTISCRKLACKWCALTGQARKPLCSTAPLNWMCARLNPNPPRNPNPSSKPKPSSNPKPPPPPNYSPRPSPIGAPPPRKCPNNRNFARAECVWQARDGPGRMQSEIVVALGQLYAPRGWTCVQRGPYVGMVYEKEKNQGIDGKGKKGKICVKIRASQTGNYFFTAMSYSPHNTEHNDVWVNSPDKGYELWQKGKLWRVAKKTEWLKAYQNNGVRGFIDQLKTKDFDGHRFIVPGVKKNEVFRICLSGRSYKYEMYRLYLIKCQGETCTGRPMFDLFGKQPTRCI